MHKAKEFTIIILIGLSILNTSMVDAVSYDPTPVVPYPHPQPYVPSPGIATIPSPIPISNYPVPPDPVREAMAQAISSVRIPGRAIPVFATSRSYRFLLTVPGPYNPVRSVTPLGKAFYPKALLPQTVAPIPDWFFPISPARSDYGICSVG
jgi:hypothetical protein